MTSIDEQLEIEGFSFLRIVENGNIMEQLPEVMKEISDREYRIVPSYIARQNMAEKVGYPGKTDAHSVYVKD